MLACVPVLEATDRADGLFGMFQINLFAGVAVGVGAEEYSCESVSGYVQDSFVACVKLVLKRRVFHRVQSAYFHDDIMKVGQ